MIHPEIQKLIDEGKISSENAKVLATFDEEKQLRYKETAQKFQMIAGIHY